MKGAKLGDVLIGLSLLAVVLSAIGAAGYDIWLASTQWLIVAVTLAIYAIYARMRA